MFTKLRYTYVTASVLLLFTLFSPIHSQTKPDPDGEGQPEMCYCDVRAPKQYQMEYEEALKKASDDAAENAMSGFIIDVYWVKEMLMTILPPTTVGDVMNEYINDFLEIMKKWFDENASLIQKKVNENALLKLQEAMNSKSPTLVGLGVYIFEKGKFGSGGWQGLDMVLDKDPGASAQFQLEFEGNIGGGFLGTAEVKLQLQISGEASVLAQKIVSITSVPKGSSVTLSGLVHGKADCSARIELQSGFSAGTKMGETQYWTNKKRSIVTLVANEKDAVCH